MAESGASQAGGRTAGGMSLGSLFFWVLTAACGAGALGLASLAWLQHMQPQKPHEWIDLVIRTIKVLLLSDIYYDDAVTGPSPGLEFRTARALGVAFSLLVAGRILLSAAGARFAGFLLGFRRGHDVVIGTGPAASEYSVAGGKRELTHVLDDGKSRLGRFAILRRDGTLKQQLKRAAAGHARRILVDEGNDSDTWQTAQAAARECRKVDVMAFISDAWVLERLSRAESEMSLRAFSYSGGAARQVMLAHPPYLLARRYKAAAQHILVVGFGAVGQAIAREFLLTSVTREPADMMITAIDPNMDALQRDFIARHPGVSGHVDIRFLAGDLRIDDADLQAVLAERTAIAPVCAVYVAISDANMPLSVGVALKDRAERLGLFDAPIFLCAEHGAGDPPVRQGAGLTGSDREDSARDMSLLYDLRITSFGSWRAALDGAGLFEETLDGQARQFHESYQKMVRKQATEGQQLAADTPWATLQDDYRAANRRVAAHIRAKLDASGFDIGEWLEGSKAGWRTHDLPAHAKTLDHLGEEGIEQLSRLEHRRWMLERTLNGWVYGPVRNAKARTHPDIKGYDELTEEARDRDRGNIRMTAKIAGDIVHGRRRKR
jgi:hypothetical protein